MTVDGPLELVVDAESVARLLIGAPAREPAALTEQFLAQLDDLLDTVEALAASGEARSLVLRSRAPGAFLGGMDLDAFEGLVAASDGAAFALEGQRVLLRFERLNLPTLAVLDGPCIGPALDLVLACKYRIASTSSHTRLGFPEVPLGLVPPFGGITRLTRLIGVRASQKLVLSGEPVTAREAHRLGLIDDAVPARRLDERVKSFLDHPASRARHRDRGRRLALLLAARRLAADPDSAGGRALAVMTEGVALSAEQAFRMEAGAFGELLVAPGTQALIHAHRVVRAGRRKAAPGTARISRTAILGAGETGSSLAYLLARARLAVRLKDRQRTALAAAIQAVAMNLARDEESMAGQLDTLTPATGFGGFGTVDLVVCAVGDRPESIHLALREAVEHSREDCILGVSSAAVRVTDAAASVANPQRVVGIHLSEPVISFPLLEVVAGAHTSAETVSGVRELARRLGCAPALVADRPGFLAPRLLGAYLAEALRILDEGPTVTQIDRALEDFGFTMGPFRRMDAIGADRVLRSLDGLAASLGERMRAAPVAARIRNTGQGFYRYRGGKPVSPNSALPVGLPDDTIAHDELIRERVVSLLVNEAALALEEGMATADDIDLVSLVGLGFPRARGGILYYAGNLGDRSDEHTRDSTGHRQPDVL